MEPLSFIIGIAVVCLFLLLIPYAIEKGFPIRYVDQDGDDGRKWITEHPFLKLISVGAVIALLTLIPGVLVENEEFCSFEVNSTNITGNFTQYTYDHICVDNPDRPALNFLRAYTWVIYIILTYLGFFFIALMIYWLQDLARRLG